MIDFEEVSDTFEEGFDKAKTFVKNNKVLVCAILGVGGFALYKAFTTKSVSDTSTYAYVPTGYDGYPEMSASVSYDDVTEQLRNETADINNDFYNEIMGDVTKLVEDLYYTNEKYLEQIATTTEKTDYTISGTYLEEQRKQNIINQMQANSEAWYTATPEEQERLHNENLVLGTSLGLTFDNESGSWLDDGYEAYTVKNKTNTSTSMLTSVGATDSSSNTEAIIKQMKANSEAWHTASETEKQRLEEENQRLGNSLGATFDSASGTWSNSNGSTLYTVNTSSKSSSGSSSSSSKSTSTSSSKSTSTSSSSTSTSSSSTSTSSSSTTKVDPVSGQTYSTVAPSWLSGPTKLNR